MKIDDKIFVVYYKYKNLYNDSFLKFYGRRWFKLLNLCLILIEFFFFIIKLC